MSFTKKLSLIISLLFVFALVACGSSGTKANNNNNNGSSGSDGFSKQVVKDDRALLEEHSYEVRTYYASSTNLSYAERQISAKEGTLKAYLYAYDSDGHGIYIYYFNSNEDAKDCYDAQLEGVKSAYRLKNNKLFVSDTTGLFE